MSFDPGEAEFDPIGRWDIDASCRWWRDDGERLVELAGRDVSAFAESQ